MALVTEQIVYYYEDTAIGAASQSGLNIIVNASKSLSGSKIIRAGTVLPKQITTGSPFNTRYYCHDEASTDIATYKKLTASSADVTEKWVVGNFFAGDPTPKVVDLVTFATEGGVPNIDSVLSGTWTAYIRNQLTINDLSITSVIRYIVLKRDSGGTETELFQVTAGGTATKTTWSRTWASHGSLAATDRIVILVSAVFDLPL